MNEQQIAPLKWAALSRHEQDLFIQSQRDEGLFSAEVEWAVLGSCMGNFGLDVLAKITRVKQEHFYFPAHQALWGELQEFALSGRKPDPVLLIKNLQSHPGFQEVVNQGSKPTDYLRGIAEYHGYDGAMIAEYVRQLIEYADRRKLINLVRSYHAKLSDTSEYPNMKPLVEGFTSEVIDISMSDDGVRQSSFQEVSEQIVQSLELPSNSTPTGIPNLDKALLGGFYPGKTYCFVARPKRGKTMLMNSIHYNIALTRCNALYYAFEMGSIELHYRFMARFLGANSYTFYNDRNDPLFRARVKAAAQILDVCARGAYVNCPTMTFDDLKNHLSAKVRSNRPAGVFLDYMGKVKGQRRGQNRSEFEEEVADWLHAFAKKNDIWVAYACQSNRDGNIRGSDGALMGADMVYMLEKDDEVNVAWLKCIASRYTAQVNVGTKASDPGLRIDSAGPHFRCASNSTISEEPDIVEMNRKYNIMPHEAVIQMLEFHYS